MLETVDLGRALLGGGARSAPAIIEGATILSYEAERPIGDYPIVALSVAYELEIAGVLRLLQGAGIPILASERGPRDPIVLAGGPLTDSNPAALLPFVDALIAGEAEELLPAAIERTCVSWVSR